MKTRGSSSEYGPLPLPPYPAELNRVLLLLSEFGGSRGLTTATLAELMASASFGARLPDHTQTLEFGRRTGLIAINGSLARISAAGRQVLMLNQSSTYELAPAQASAIAEQCVFSGPYRPVSTEILRQFGPVVSSGKFSIELAGLVLRTELHRAVFSFLRDLGVVHIRDCSAEVAALFSARVSALRGSKKMTPEELHLLLERRRAQGTVAEQWVFNYEERRLRAASCEFEASSIELVSAIDVAAGYDIASFDGESEALAFDRFIEVKSTAGMEPVFVWSAHERDVARVLGRRYWIYLVIQGGLSPESAQLLTIRDPVSLCGSSGRLKLTPIEFRAVFVGS